MQAYQGSLRDITQLYKIRYENQLNLYKDANKYNLQLYFFCLQLFCISIKIDSSSLLFVISRSLLTLHVIPSLMYKSSTKTISL